MLFRSDQYVGLIHGIDDALAAGEKLFPLRGERDTAGCSMQNLKPDSLFKAVNLPADRCLGTLQFFGRTGESTLVDHGRKDHQRR